MGDLREKIIDILCRFYHDDEAETADEIISLCQPQWISAELQIIVNEIKRSMGDFKFQLLVDDLEGIIAKLEPPEESK